MATPEPVTAAPPPPVQRAADPADVVASLPPPETPSAAASATATTPGAESSRVARVPDQASEPGDSEVGPLEQPATILIDDTPDIEPPPARVDTETPKRRFSFRVNEGADVKKPQTYEEWRRQAEEERASEGHEGHILRAGRSKSTGERHFALPSPDSRFFPPQIPSSLDSRFSLP